MRFSVFERVAAEARTGMREIDAEIDRLIAKKELLEVLESTAQQVLTVVPVSTRAAPPAADNTKAVRRATEYAANALLKDESDPLPQARSA